MPVSGCRRLVNKTSEEASKVLSSSCSKMPTKNMPTINKRKSEMLKKWKSKLRKSNRLKWSTSPHVTKIITKESDRQSIRERVLVKNINQSHSEFWDKKLTSSSKSTLELWPDNRCMTLKSCKRRFKTRSPSKSEIRSNFPKEIKTRMVKRKWTMLRRISSNNQWSTSWTQLSSQFSKSQCQLSGPLVRKFNQEACPLVRAQCLQQACDSKTKILRSTMTSTIPS